jgi:hypothetical protein
MIATDAARPSCTEVMEATAIPAPARAVFFMAPVDEATTARVHVIVLDVPFRIRE